MKWYVKLLYHSENNHAKMKYYLPFFRILKALDKFGLKSFVRKILTRTGKQTEKN